LTLLGAAGVAKAGGAVAAPTTTALAAAGGVAAATSAATFAQVATSILIGALAGLGVAVPASYLAERSTPSAQQRAPVPAGSVTARATAPRQPLQMEPNASSATSAMTASPVPLAPARSEARALGNDTLAGETRLLELARSRLKAGQAEESLRLLEQYQRAFPAGVLGEEAAASKVVALCALGRRREAERGVTQFRSDFPHSPLHPRVASVCGEDEP
jgi:RNA polymerase sigma-70 factor (ECF subfamily)